jgi:hypothetical protein
MLSKLNLKIHCRDESINYAGTICLGLDLTLGTFPEINSKAKRS